MSKKLTEEESYENMHSEMEEHKAYLRGTTLATQRDAYRNALEELAKESSLLIRVYGDHKASTALKHAVSILNSSEGKE